MWNKIRLPIMVVLIITAAFVAGKNLGYREGIQVKYGGPGNYKTAIIEWQNISERKQVVYLNDGTNGYAFWFKMNPQFRHYTYAAKVFTCNNESDVDIKEKMDMARDWCAHEWDGGDTRITGGELYPKSDEGASSEPEKNKFTDEEVQHQAELEEINQLRLDVDRLVRENERLKREVSFRR